MLIAGAICLFAFSIQNNLSAQSPYPSMPDYPSCEATIDTLQGHVLWDDGYIECPHCVLTTGDPYPVYENGVMIGYEYETSMAYHEEYYVVCEAVPDPMDCIQISLYIDDSRICTPYFVPDGEDDPWN